MPDFIVTPWEVSGEVDYDQIIQEFGIELIDDKLLFRLKEITSEIHPFLTRKIFFAHRDLNWILDEYQKVKVELSKFMKVAEEAEESEYNFERVRALLSIYTVLVSEIWQGQPHYRILMTLHGETDEMTRDQIKNTTGIGGAFVLHSVQELAKVGLVEYDMDTSTVKLIKRLFPKKALEQK